jgi:hypothetical protein
MKKIFLFLSMIAAIGANAQGLTAGLRGGASYWMQGGDKTNKPQTMRGQHISPDVEAFVRRSRGKWAFEGALGASALQYGMADGMYFFECGNGISDFTTEIRNVDLTLSVQRDITCPAMKSCPLLGRFRNYIGVSVTGAATRSTARFINENAGSDMSYTTYKFWTGVNNTLTFDLCKKTQIIATGYVRIVPTDFFSSYHFYEFNPVARAGVQLGGAYKF